MTTTSTTAIRLAAAALGLAALVGLGATTLAGAPAVTDTARARPGAVPTLVAPRVPAMQLGKTEGEPAPPNPMHYEHA